MALHPPTYEIATSRDPWPIIAPYVPVNGLRSACLVCRQWHQTFAPHLWGHPASHFKVEDDSVFGIAILPIRRYASLANHHPDAVIRFLSILPHVRLFVRQMTHTLHLPPAHAEAYDGPHLEWLMSVLVQLPHLQCLIVDEISFFDHAALLELRRSITTYNERSIRPTQYSLRLLSAANCEELSSLGLCEAFKHLPYLVYLDISGCAEARHQDVYSAFASLLELQVLIMREVELNDADLETIAKAVRFRIRSLDVRNNQLTDASVEHLSCYCFRPEGVDARTSRCSDARRAGMHSDLASNIRQVLTSGSRYPLLTEAQRDNGITHLYLSGNDITDIGLLALFKKTRLCALDAGILSSEKGIEVTGASTNQDLVNAEPILSTSSIKSVTREHAMDTLTYLRIHHRLVTGFMPTHAVNGSTNQAADNGIPRSIVAESSHPDAKARSIETDTAEPPPYQDVGETMTICKTDSQGAAETQSTQSPGNEELRNTRARSSNAKSGTEMTENEEFKVQPPPTPCHVHSIPHLFPALRTLVLTAVPEYSDSEIISQELISFIKACAKETDQANAEARLSYASPPGQNRQAFERDYARSIFALETLVLEMAAPNSPNMSGGRMPQQSVFTKVSAYRRRKNGDYQGLVESGIKDPHVEGYWAGNVEVRRPYLQEDAS